MGSLKAGVSKVNITPYVGIWLAGFGSRYKGSEAIHDDLYARAIVFDDGNENLAMVSCDLVSLDIESVESIRKMAQDMTGLKGENIFVSTTHTHSAPLSCGLRGFGPLDKAWVEILEKKIAGAIAIAARNMQEVSIGSGSGEAKINRNRRGEKALDQELGVIRVNNSEGNAMAVIMNYPCHPVIVPPNTHTISADYPGYAISVIEKNCDGAIGLFFTGTCGDIDPISHGTFEEVERLGNIVGAEALKVCLEITATTSDVNLRAAKENLILKSQEIPTAEELQKMVDAGSKSQYPDLDWQYNWAVDALECAKAGKRSEDVPIEIQALALGDNIVVVGIPGEVFVEIGLTIKENSPFAQAFPVECTNGCIGYMPTVEAFDRGGYEPDDAFKLYGIYPVDRDVARKVIGAASRLMNKINAG